MLKPSPSFALSISRGAAKIQRIEAVSFLHRTIMPYRLHVDFRGRGGMALFREFHA